MKKSYKVYHVDVEVDCVDESCPFVLFDYTGDNYPYPICTAEQNRKAEHILYGKGPEAPDWCPLRSGPVVVKAKT